ncbi:MAG TPA: hypothetical protein VGD69_03540 [Herpetosiphonaceae bacterium]
MDASQSSDLRPVTNGMRWMLLIASGLVFTVGIQLYILTEQTERYFAWTINPPLTAAFLGAGYWASFAMEFLASRKRFWAHARIAVPAVLIFTTLTLIATLLHLDRFHLNDPNFVTRVAAWVWLAVYAIVPLVMTVLLVLQMRVPGYDPPRQAPLPRWIHLILRLHAVVMLPLGAALFLAPQATAPLWPWMLTPLTARAVGAWLLALGVAAAHSSRENDWQRVHIATISYTVLGFFQLLALARYPQVVDWTMPAAWIYLVFLVSILLVGLYGWRQSARLSRVEAIAAAPTVV